jgi:predicted NAD-dependent protein-ADP-ribosyltransferase YbiA (DUF1768 family)
MVEDIDFIRRSLGNPKGLQLLFRASQHYFKAHQFHKYCDDIEDTFVLIRTEHGKTIAGYSHYKWNQVDCGYVSDPDRRAFLLQLDSNKRLIPTSDHNLICCSSNDGPVFGSSDLCIGDNCNNSSTSWS